MSKAGTSVDVRIRDASLHRVIRQGSQRAEFHECAGCGELVLVTATFEGETYGALNARCLRNKLEFTHATEVDYSNHTAEQKQERWRQNWCAPVCIVFLSGKAERN